MCLVENVLILVFTSKIKNVFLSKSKLIKELNFQVGNDNVNGMLANSISLTQNVNANSGCCDGLAEVLSCIKDLKNDINVLLEANGIDASSGNVCREPPSDL